MSAGDRARIEGAFLPRDGVDDRTRRRTRQAREARHAKGGEGEIVERDAALRCELAEGERNPGVAGLRDHLAQRGDLRFVAQMLHGVGGEWAGRDSFSPDASSNSTTRTKSSRASP